MLKETQKRLSADGRGDLAQMVGFIRRALGHDYPIPNGKGKEVSGDMPRVSEKQLKDLREKLGWDPVVVVVDAWTLRELEEQTGVKSYLYGSKAENAAKAPAMRTEVAINLTNPKPRETYGKPFDKQKSIVEQANELVDGLTVTHPPTPADAATIAQKVFDQTGTNILPDWTRVGKEGAVIVGSLNPGVGVHVEDFFRPDEAYGDIGLLSVAVPTAALEG